MFTILLNVINAVKVTLTPEQQYIKEHQMLFDSAIIQPDQQWLIDKMLNKLLIGKDKYQTVSLAFNNIVPWWFILMTHAMEAGGFENPFLYHLHCGDPLTARTFHVPIGRPKFNPKSGTTPPSKLNPYTWEESAIDALQQFKDPKETDWSVGACLWREEQYNGLGYRKYHKQVHTPYVWSFTNHYGKSPSIGKYVLDGKWDATAISKQPGCATFLIRLKEKGLL